MKKNYSKQLILFGLILVIFMPALLFQDCGKSGSESSSSTKLTQNNDALGQSELPDKGKEIAGRINATLINALSSAIDENGYEGAIEFCSLNAIPITDSISLMDGVKIQRISHKPRNNANAANETELELIDRYKNVSGNETSKKQPSVILENDKNIFYAPIYIASPLCLNCHGKVGSDIQQEVYESIQRKYPNDKATGFEMNELRGLLKILFQ